MNFFNLLKPKGLLRLVFPDLEIWSKNYVNKNDKFFIKYKEFFLNNYPLASTPGDIFMYQVQNWKNGHKWCYDYESIELLLKKVGYNNITKSKAGEINIEQIKSFELEHEERQFESCYVNAYKF